MSKNNQAKKQPRTQRAPAKRREPLPVQLVELAIIDPSPLNRDPGSVKDLVPSIREHGVQQPIKLRPKAGRFEIVYGERRFRAAKEASLKTIPATVEDLTDEEAHELRVIENACREDPHPLDEAEAFERLLAMKDSRGEPLHDADSLAKLVARSPQYVYTRLKLTALGPAMRQAFREGQLTVTTAFLVARAVPLDLQDQALAELREMFADEGEENPFPADELAHHIELSYLTRLEHAPFSLKDAKLVPQAGACTRCPKRSGNQPALFADEIPKDTCADRTCFRAKLQAHREKLAADVVAKGGVVLTEHQSNEIFRGNHQLPWNSKHVDIDGPCFDDPARRTWREILGDVCPKLTLATDPRGVPHALVLRAEALAALQRAGVDFDKNRNTGAPEGAPVSEAARHGGDCGHGSGSRDPAVAHAAAQLRHATVSNILAAITAAAEARDADDATFARLIFESMNNGGYHDAITDTVKRRGLPRAKGEAPGAVLTAHSQGLDGKGLRALILELALARGAYFAWSTKYPELLIAAATAYAIDIPAIENGTAEDLEAKRAQRSARKPAKALGSADG